MPSIPSALETLSNQQEPQGATVWLMRIDLPNGAESILLTTNNADITFNGDTYQAFPFDVPGEENSADGNAGEIQIAIGNINGEWSDIMDATEGMTDSIVTLHYGNTLYTGTPANWTRITLVVSTSTEHNASVVLSLIPIHVFAANIPQMVLWRDSCPFTYKSVPGCFYDGDLPSCDKTFDGANGCRAHGNHNNFGGEPSIPRIK